MPNCYYYDEQSDHCNCYVDENLNELLEENVNLRVQLANAMVTVRRVDERCANLRSLATHALRHIIEFECEADNREQFQGKPCEWCVYHGSSDCPKIIAVMYGELGIEVPE